MTILHRCRFVEWRPETISAMGMSPSGTRPLLAVVRHNGDLDLLDASQNWAVSRIPAGGAIGRAIESVVWLHPRRKPSQRNDDDITMHYSLHEVVVIPWKETSRMPFGRLFTAGHDGLVVEWDVERHLPRRHLEIGGGGIWCMTKSPDEKYLAVGCEDGAVRVVNVKKFEVVRLFSIPLKSDSKLLSITWASIGNLIAVGTSESSIVIVKFETGQIMHRISMELIYQKPTMVWCVKFAGKSLISGNSIGQVQFWDPELGTLINTCKLHSTDILTIAVHSSQERALVSTSDGRTIDFHMMGSDEIPLWRQLDKITLHTHDVRASIFGHVPAVRVKDGQSKFGFCEVFISGGVDTQLAIFRLDAVGKGRTRFLSPLPQHEIIKVAPECRLLAAQTDSSIDLWMLGRVKGKDSRAQLSGPGRKLLRLNVPRGESVWSFDVSSNGQFLAYSTRSTLRLYHLDLTKRSSESTVSFNIQKQRLADFPKNVVVQAVAFACKSKLLAVATVSEQSTKIIFLKLDSTTLSPKGEVVLYDKEAIAVERLLWKDELVVALDSRNTLHFIDTKTFSVSKVITTFPTKIIALRFVPVEEPVLFTVMADKRLSIINLTKNETLTVSNLPHPWTANTEQIKGIAFAPDHFNKIRLWSEKFIVEADWNELSSIYTCTTSRIDQCIKNSQMNRPDQTVINQESVGMEVAWVPTSVKGDRKHGKSGRSSTDLSNTERKQAMTESVNFGDHLKSHTSYSRILFFDYISADEAVLIERPWGTILNTLPKAQDRKEYGGF